MHKLRLIFGTSKIHHQVFEKQRFQLLYDVREKGIDTFDTAITYGHGCAVETLSKFRKQHPEIKINSKVGLANAYKRTNFFLEQIIRRKLFSKQSSDYRLLTIQELQIQLDKNIKLLGCDFLECCYIHEPLLDSGFISELEEFRFRNCNKFKYFGVGAPTHLITPWKSSLQQREFATQASLYNEICEWVEPENAIFEGDTVYGLFTAKTQLQIHDRIRLIEKSGRSLVFSTSRKRHLNELLSHV